ncbi:MAG: hypothetical protein ACREJC_15160 [Tepidisphaeraceae bacterium]
MPNERVPQIGVLPAVIEVDVLVLIKARVQTLSNATDVALSQAVLTQIAILAPFAARVQQITVQRGGIVGVAPGGVGS